MRLVVLETPYAGDVVRNVRFANACVLDCLRRGEAPFASHLLYTGALDDLVPEERLLGIQAGFAWRSRADATVVYTDLGVSGGMKMGIAHAEDSGRPVEYRELGEGWETSLRLLQDSGECCMAAHANAVPPWTCECACHKRNV